MEFTPDFIVSHLSEWQNCLNEVLRPRGLRISVIGLTKAPPVETRVMFGLAVRLTAGRDQQPWVGSQFRDAVATLPDTHPLREIYIQLGFLEGQSLMIGTRPDNDRQSGLGAKRNEPV